MACYHMMTGYRSKSGRDKTTGKWPVVFSVKDGYKDLKVEIPCGKCIGCKLEKSRQWAIRCVHESKLYKQNCFLTLTYNEESIKQLEIIDETIEKNNIKKQYSLNKRHFTLFVKRLRKKYGNNIRYIQCGEYGEKFSRPHHHACIFNFDFPDKELWKIKSNSKLYTSESLNKLWRYGYCVIGEVTFDSAAYISRYVTKKITGSIANEHYDGREPEYITMSRRPGIGKKYLDKFAADIYNYDKVILDSGREMRPAKYYDAQYELDHPEQMRKIKIERKNKRVLIDQDRLQTIEKSKTLKLKQLSRIYEGD